MPLLEPWLDNRLQYKIYIYLIHHLAIGITRDLIIYEWRFKIPPNSCPTINPLLIFETRAITMLDAVPTISLSRLPDNPELSFGAIAKVDFI